MDSIWDKRVWEAQRKLDDIPEDRRKSWVDKLPPSLRDRVRRREAAADDIRDDAPVLTPRSLEFADPDSLPIGCVVDGKYRIDAQVAAQGGMGFVYRATQLDEGFARTVALKVVQKLDAELTRRFFQERQILSALDDPHIVRAFDTGKLPDTRPYFVMEWIEEGKPITVYCQERRLRLEDRLKLFRQVCAAVVFAHERGIVHRDLKPANILVDGRGRLKLLDFGLATLLRRDEGKFAFVSAGGGTDAYTSPEQLGGAGKVTDRCDQYALGVLLYELLCAKLPLDAASRRIIQPAVKALSLTGVAVITPPSKANRWNAPITKLVRRRRLRGDLDAIVLKALEYFPPLRCESVKELSHGIGCWLDGQRIPFLPPPSRIRRTRQFARRHPRLTNAALIATAAAAGASVAHGAYQSDRIQSEISYGDIVRTQVQEAAALTAQRDALLREKPRQALEDARHFRALGDAEAAARQFTGADTRDPSVVGQVIEADVKRLSPGFALQNVGRRHLLFEAGADLVFTDDNGRMRRFNAINGPVFEGTFVRAIDEDPFVVGFGNGVVAGVTPEGTLSIVTVTESAMEVKAVEPGVNVGRSARSGSAAPGGEHLSLIADGTGLIVINKAAKVVHTEGGVDQAHWLSGQTLVIAKDSAVFTLDLSTRTPSGAPTLADVPALAGTERFVIGKDGMLLALRKHDTLLFDAGKNEVIGCLKQKVLSAAFAPAGRRFAVLRQDGGIASYLVEPVESAGSAEPADEASGGAGSRQLRPVATAATDRRLTGAPGLPDPKNPPRLRFNRDDTFLLVSGYAPRLLGSSSLVDIRTFSDFRAVTADAVFVGADGDRIAMTIPTANGTATRLSTAPIASGLRYERQGDAMELPRENGVTGARVRQETCLAADSQVDGSIVLKEADGREVIRLEGLDEEAEQILFDPGLAFVMARSKGRVRVWNLEVSNGEAGCRTR
jgi:serine/threonine protein kinase